MTAINHSDGTEVSSIVLSKMIWKNGFPNDNDDNATCIVWQAGEIMNTQCGHNRSDTTVYYKGTEDEQAIIGYPSYNLSDYHRGFLCEAKPVHTVPIKSSPRGILCIFPFRYVKFTITSKI